MPQCPTPSWTGNYGAPLSLARLSHGTDTEAQPHRERQFELILNNEKPKFDGIHMQSKSTYKTVHIERNIIQMQLTFEQHNIMWALKSSICISRGLKSVARDFKPFCWIQCPPVDATNARTFMLHWYYRPPVSLAGLSHGTDTKAQPHRETGWIHFSMRKLDLMEFTRSPICHMKRSGHTNEYYWIYEHHTMYER